MINKIFFVLLFFTVLQPIKAQDATFESCIFPSFSAVKIDTLFQDKISIRAILIDEEKIWYAGNNNRFGFFDLKQNKKSENKIVADTLKLEFRSIAKTNKFIYVLSVGNPAMLYQISKNDCKTTKLVYQERNEKVFYDSMQFWNDKEGIAVGDPITNHLCILKTIDGGFTWYKLPDNIVPELMQGEAHFAASNTNIVVKEDNTWIVSGGKKSRVFYSANMGKSWEVYETPIDQGKQMTGIFTADFYDAKNGFVAGGNYEDLNQNFDNKAVTYDGGKTWKSIANNVGFGYTSCVQYVPKSRGNGIVTVGASGFYYSPDAGKNWMQFSQDKSLLTVRFLNENTAIAAGNNKMIRIHFK